jgi:uncharacterized protein (TIGR02453 family)
MTAKTAKAAKTAKPTRAAFTGFARSAPGFFHELSVEMNRDWFLANKQRYETEWVDPMTALLEDVGQRLAPAYRPRKLSAPRIMRIYRDVRFSKDKAPYKTHIGAALTTEGKRVGPAGTTAMYIHLGVDEEFVGVGTYFFEPDKLAKWRKVVAGKQGAKLLALVNKLRDAGYEVGGHDDFKKVPRGFAPEHPHAELLKLKGLTGGPGAIPRGLIHKPAFADWLVEHGKRLAPMVLWLDEHVS